MKFCQVRKGFQPLIVSPRCDCLMDSLYGALSRLVFPCRKEYSRLNILRELHLPIHLCAVAFHLISLLYLNISFSATLHYSSNANIDDSTTQEGRPAECWIWSALRNCCAQIPCLLGSRSPNQNLNLGLSESSHHGCRALSHRRTAGTAIRLRPMSRSSTILDLDSTGVALQTPDLILRTTCASSVVHRTPRIRLKFLLELVLPASLNTYQPQDTKYEV